MERIALVDFCETIVSFQTYDSFLKFVLINELPRHFKIIGNKKFIKMYEILEKNFNQSGRGPAPDFDGRGILHGASVPL